MAPVGADVVVVHPFLGQIAGRIPGFDVAGDGGEALVFQRLVERSDLAVRPRMAGTDGPLEEAELDAELRELVGEEALGVVGEEKTADRERSLLAVVVECDAGVFRIGKARELEVGEGGKTIDDHEAIKALARCASLPPC